MQEASSHLLSHSCSLENNLHNKDHAKSYFMKKCQWRFQVFILEILEALFSKRKLNLPSFKIFSVISINKYDSIKENNVFQHKFQKKQISLMAYCFDYRKTIISTLPRSIDFLKNKFIYLFNFGCIGSSLLHGLSLVVASGHHSSLWFTCFSLQWPLLLRSTGSRLPGSRVQAQ